MNSSNNFFSPPTQVALTVSSPRPFPHETSSNLSKLEASKKITGILQNTNLSLDDKLRQIVDAVGPRTYNMKMDGYETVDFLAQGCQGEAGEAQKSVARLQKEAAKKADQNKLSMGVILGDNKYDKAFDGIYSPTSQFFKTHFHDIYSTDLPYIVIFGNHDGGYSSLHTSLTDTAGFTKQGRKLERNQAAHTYIQNIDLTDPKLVQKVRELTDQFLEDNLDPKKLPSWVMPYYYNSYIFGDTQLFCLNTNHMDDFVDYFTALETGKTLDITNQGFWLAQELQKAIAANRQLIFAQHHGPFTVSKRAKKEKYDSSHYLNPEQLTALNLALADVKLKNILQKNNIPILSSNLDTLTRLYKNYKKNLGSKSEFTEKLNTYIQKPDLTNTIFTELDQELQSYNELWDLVLQKMQVNAKAYLVAHDHFMAYYNNHEDKEAVRKNCVITSGGGGAEPAHLQNMESLKGFPYIHHLKKNGYVQVSFPVKNPKELDIHYHTTDGFHLQFNEKSHHAITSLDDQTSKLRKEVLALCQEHIAAWKNPAPIVAPPPQKKSTSSPYKKSHTWNMWSAVEAIKTGYQNGFQIAQDYYSSYMAAPAYTPEELTALNHVMAYLNQSKLPYFDTVVKDLKKITEKLPADKENSFGYNMKNLLDPELIKSHYPTPEPSVTIPEDVRTQLQFGRPFNG